MNARASTKETETAEAAIAITLTAPRKAMADAMKRIRRALTANGIGKRESVYPILKYVAVRASAFGVTLTYHGLDMAYSEPVGGEGAGALMLPISALAGFVSAADGEYVTLTKDAAEASVKMVCGRTNATVVPMDISAAPEAFAKHNFTSGKPFAFASGALPHLFALALPFVSNEEVRYYLNGVFFEVLAGDASMLRMVATDGHRMGMRSHTLPAPSKPLAAILPRGTADFLNAIIGDDEVHSAFVDAAAEFRFGGRTVSTKLIEGTFPDWRRVVPDYSESHGIQFDTKQALQFLKAARLMRTSERSYRAVSIEAKAGAVSMSATSGETVLGVNADVAGSGTEGHALGMNAAYLESMLRMFKSEEVSIRFKDAGSPYRLTKAWAEPGALTDDLVILMPMRF